MARKKTVSNETNENKKEIPKTYTVKKGDTLHLIANMFDMKWYNLYLKNKDKINFEEGENISNSIKEGDILKIK